MTTINNQPEGVVPYEVINPVLLKDKLKGILSIPEGSYIGFDGKTVYALDHLNNWREMLTERSFVAQWIENGSIKKKLLQKTPCQEAIQRLYTPHQQAPEPTYT